MNEYATEGRARPARGGFERRAVAFASPGAAAANRSSPSAPAPWGGGTGAARLCRPRALVSTFRKDYSTEALP